MAISLFCFSLRLCVSVVILFLPVAAQRVSILTPDKAARSIEFAEKLGAQLGEMVTVLDAELGKAAYLSTSVATPFNLTADESKKIGAVVGCDFFIILRATVQRRSSFQRSEYYEAYAPIYVVSSRSGGMILWKLARADAAKPDAAWHGLVDSIKGAAAEITAAVGTANRKELIKREPAEIEEVPDENSALAKNFKAPIPYRRFKPDYTEQAALYDIAATVDIVVDIDSNGTILRTEIVRWAGFGLDESVEKTVRSMNWRPAERAGKFLPMRVLLRYNFKKVDK